MLRIDRLRTRSRKGTHEISARISSPVTGEQRLWIRWEEPQGAAPPPGGWGDPFVTAMLMPAMAMGEEIFVDAPVSPSLVESLGRAMRFLQQWNDWKRFCPLSPVEIRATAMAESPSEGQSTGLFFSGGVDSLYSLIAGPSHGVPRPAWLLFVHGFDLPPQPPEWARRIESRIASLASELDLRLLRVQTNLKEIVNALVHWELSHGGGLAAVGHGLASELAEVQISSADNSVTDGPSGAHWRLDPCWSSQKLQFSTVAPGVTRIDKLTFLADEPLAREHLRVCYRNRGDSYNCGVCTKCLRTMILLHALGRLGEFRCFPDTLSPRRLTPMIEPPQRWFLWAEARERLSARRGEEEYVRVIDDLVETWAAAFSATGPRPFSRIGLRAWPIRLRSRSHAWPPAVRYPLVTLRRDLREVHR